MFEEKWNVRISNHVLEVENPKHVVQRVQLEEINRIFIETNDSGPIDSDVIWCISDGKLTISFPLGATGESDVLSAFQKFEGFDNLELISAMSSSENNTFILFEKVKA